MSLPDNLVEQARGVPIEGEAERRGLRLRGHIDRCGPCPICGGTDRFSINISKQVWLCRGCKKGGNVVDLCMWLDGLTFVEAVLQLAGETAPGRQAPNLPAPPLSPRNDNDDGRRAALRLWSESKDPRGTLAERYLAGRAEKLALPDDLASSMIRFHGAAPWHDDDSGELVRVPCMVALMRDTLTGEPRAIQKTRLTADATKVARKMRGPAKGAALMLDPFEAVELGLHIAEGLESAMAARVLGFRPVWALGSASGIETFPVLDGVESLTVLCETDDSGANKRAANACADRWQAAGREVLFAEPQIHGDMADVLARITS